MRTMFAIACAGSLLIGLGSAPASAGGSWMRPLSSSVEPGDEVTMVGFSGFGNLDDGPFYAYLNPAPYLFDENGDVVGAPVDPEDLDEAGADTWPFVDGMERVGEITITATGSTGWRTYRLHVTFTVPAELADGHYDLGHCNDPCTTNFGEMISGSFRVGDGGNDGSLDGPLLGVANLDEPLVAELLRQPGAVQQLPRTGANSFLFVVGLTLTLVGVAFRSIGHRR